MCWALRAQHNLERRKVTATATKTTSAMNLPLAQTNCSERSNAGVDNSYEPTNDNAAYKTTLRVGIYTCIYIHMYMSMRCGKLQACNSDAGERTLNTCTAIHGHDNCCCCGCCSCCCCGVIINMTMKLNLTPL